jgi:hypothetical protein
LASIGGTASERIKGARACNDEQNTRGACPIYPSTYLLTHPPSSSSSSSSPSSRDSHSRQWGVAPRIRTTSLAPFDRCKTITTIGGATRLPRKRCDRTVCFLRYGKLDPTICRSLKRSLARSLGRAGRSLTGFVSTTKQITLKPRPFNPADRNVYAPPLRFPSKSNRPITR